MSTKRIRELRDELSALRRDIREAHEATGEAQTMNANALPASLGPLQPILQAFAERLRVLHQRADATERLLLELVAERLDN